MDNAARGDSFTVIVFLLIERQILASMFKPFSISILQSAEIGLYPSLLQHDAAYQMNGSFGTLSDLNR